MTDWTTDRAVDALLDAEARRADRGPLTDEWPDLDLRTAYEIQDHLVSRRVDAGEKVVGVGLAATSRAERERWGVDAPLTAWLTDAMVLPAGEAVPLDELIHPRVRPEIAFLLGRRLRGPGVTAATALAAVESVHCGVGVVDSRFTVSRCALADVVADNASAARVVLGSVGLPATGLDLALEACLLQVDGEVVDSATGAAVHGNPAEALALAANALAERDLALEPGWLVFTGPMTDAVPVVRGKQITAEFTHLGSVTTTGG